MVKDNNIAISFAEWLSKGEWVKRKATHPSKIGKYYSHISCEYKTIEELYEIFKPLVKMEFPMWIPISEGFPDNKQHVLARLNFAGAPNICICQCVFVKKYCTDKVEFDNMFVGLDGGLYSHHGVIEWMPMPK